MARFGIIYGTKPSDTQSCEAFPSLKTEDRSQHQVIPPPHPPPGGSGSCRFPYPKDRGQKSAPSHPPTPRREAVGHVDFPTLKTEDRSQHQVIPPHPPPGGSGSCRFPYPKDRGQKSAPSHPHPTPRREAVGHVDFPTLKTEDRSQHQVIPPLTPRRDPPLKTEDRSQHQAGRQWVM